MSPPITTPKPAYIKPRTARHKIPPKKPDMESRGAKPFYATHDYQKILEIPSDIVLIDVIDFVGYTIPLSY
jgi:hypothetical protein